MIQWWDQLQGETDGLKKKLGEAEKLRLEIVNSTNSLEEMLYRCWAFNQDGDFSFMESAFGGPYLAKFKVRFS